MSSVVRALGFLTCNLNPRPTSECDCAFYQEVENDLFTWQVALLTTCMTTPDDSSCTINAVSDSLPLMVCSFLKPLHNSFLGSFALFSDLLLFPKIFHLAQLFPGDEHGQLHDVDRGQRLHEQLWSDKQLRQQLRIQSGWMGSTAEYVSIAMVTLIFYHISWSGMPSIIQCTMGTTALTFSNEATTNSDGDKVTTDSCNVAKWYEQVRGILIIRKLFSEIKTCQPRQIFLTCDKQNFHSGHLVILHSVWPTIEQWNILSHGGNILEILSRLFFSQGSCINYIITFWGPERPPPPPCNTVIIQIYPPSM